MRGKFQTSKSNAILNANNMTNSLILESVLFEKSPSSKHYMYAAIFGYGVLCSQVLVEVNEDLMYLFVNK